jgi:uncharacterized Fe-S cluster-containing radical SAM superfamily protein
MTHAPGRVRRSYALRRAGRRLTGARSERSGAIPDRPIGAKLELTYHCNLRCSFCYTDSPRRTLARTAEMDDAEWRRIVGEVVDLGVIEVVLTGGEPLLRKELTLEAVERISASGAMVTLNTNGWFLDADAADRLAAAGARVHVSIDGASPELHDASRGVPGSWRRATEAVAMLLDRGVRVQVVHVITPRNAATFGEFLDQMRVLAPTSVRATLVGRIGAAARDGDWDVEFARIKRAADGFDPGGRPRLLLQDELAGSLVALDHVPRAFLVRPNGAFLADSQHPFSFGHAASQPLADCWAELRDAWADDRIQDWRGGAKDPGQTADRDLVPYRDEERVIAGADPGRAEQRKSGEELQRALEVLESKAPPFPADGRGEVGAASGRVRALAMSRRHRLARVRWSGSRRGERLVRIAAGGRIHALNATAGIVMDALAGGSTGDAADALLAEHPSLDRATAERDALEATAALVEAGIAVPALAPRDDIAATSDDGSLSGLPD